MRIFFYVSRRRIREDGKCDLITFFEWYKFISFGGIPDFQVNHREWSVLETLFVKVPHYHAYMHIIITERAEFSAYCVALYARSHMRSVVTSRNDWF
mgnify:CR=1 FL=1